MSYYFKHNYSFSDHGLQRASERLRLKDMDFFSVKEHCMKLIDNSLYQFETSRHIYIKVAKSELFFVVNKLNNLVVTVTKMSVSRQLEVIDKDI
ncbi:hypothetical protein SSABA_v1c04840 [Spiroplasma sabaudiense Ar-1343]|uniref:Uncharacterized protein n=1 Tax=Spiroplasma sabaudiense Ar-1343 TaxID=1276257 RepID=W6AA57_9MOLU|nr:hypothetical protein [Spiroplasma sabaudiense]AHI53891.1 hypothetical protein SSABA_v1c04840 [Spiroplasma sabaudiense Ar-1343]